MPEPRIMIGVHTLRSTKLIELPSDRYRVAWLDLLIEAKLQQPEGVFASMVVVRFHAKHRRDCVPGLLDAGLLHAAPAMCARCRKAFGEVPAQAVVVHDWHDYQEPSRWTRWRNDKNAAPAPLVAPTPAPPVATFVQPSLARASVSVSDSVSPERNDGSSLNGPFPAIDSEAVVFLEGLTARHIRQAGDKQLAVYDRHIAEHGMAAVRNAYQRVADTLKADRRTTAAPTAAQLVYSGQKLLERFVDPSEVAEAEKGTPRPRPIRPPRDEAAIRAERLRLIEPGATA